MSADRVVVGVHLLGSSVDEFYWRDEELTPDRGSKPTVRHLLTVNRSEAAVFSESVGKSFAEQLKTKGAAAVWLIDLATGRRIEIQPGAPAAEDTRVPSRVCLDEIATPESKWWAVYPTTTPLGKKWYIRCSPPGLAEQILYDDSPTLCVERARALRMLDWAEKAPTPTASELGVKPEVQNSAPAYRVRPGELR